MTEEGPDSSTFTITKGRWAYGFRKRGLIRKKLRVFSQPLPQNNRGLYQWKHWGLLILLSQYTEVQWEGRWGHTEYIHQYHSLKERTVASPEKVSSRPHLQKPFLKGIIDVSSLNAVQVHLRSSTILNQTLGVEGTKNNIFRTLCHFLTEPYEYIINHMVFSYYGKKCINHTWRCNRLLQAQRFLKGKMLVWKAKTKTSYPFHLLSGLSSLSVSGFGTRGMQKEASNERSWLSGARF